MAAKYSLTKFKNKNIKLISLRLVSLFLTTIKTKLTKTFKTFKTKSPIIREKLITSINQLKKRVKISKSKRWPMLSLFNKRIESHKKCQLAHYRRPNKSNYLINLIKLKREKFKFQINLWYPINQTLNLMKLKLWRILWKSWELSDKHWLIKSLTLKTKSSAFKIVFKISKRQLNKFIKN